MGGAGHRLDDAPRPGRAPGPAGARSARCGGRPTSAACCSCQTASPPSRPRWTRASSTVAVERVAAAVAAVTRSVRGRQPAPRIARAPSSRAGERIGSRAWPEACRHRRRGRARAELRERAVRRPGPRRHGRSTAATRAAARPGCPPASTRAQYLSAEDIELRVRSVDRLMAHAEAGVADAAAHRRAAARARRRRWPRATARRPRCSASLGVEDATVLDPEELSRLLPDFDADGVVAALYCPSDGYLDGAELCAGLAERVQAAGVELVVRGGVEGVRRESTGGYDAGHRRAASSRPTCRQLRRRLGAARRRAAGGAGAGRQRAPRGVRVRAARRRRGHHPDDARQRARSTARRASTSVRRASASWSPACTPTRSSAQSRRSRRLLRGRHPRARGARVERLAAAFPQLEASAIRAAGPGMYPHSPDGRGYAGPHPDNPGHPHRRRARRGRAERRAPPRLRAGGLDPPRRAALPDRRRLRPEPGRHCARLTRLAAGGSGPRNESSLRGRPEAPRWESSSTSPLTSRYSR